jgi:tRNA threonylcarbamoyladenosine biosynthesis protein TsaE
MKTILSRSPGQTRQLAKALLKSANSTRMFLLFGNLGSGKTEFVKGLAEGLNLKNKVTSPTYTLIKTYGKSKTGRKLHHIDLYRIKSAKELLTIGVEDLISEKNTFTAIEWPELLYSNLNFKKHFKKAVNIYFKHAKKESERKIRIAQ